MVAEAAGGIYSTATGSGTSYDKAEDFAHDTALLMLGLLFLKGSVVSMQNSVTACKSAAQELVGRISRIRSSEVLAEAGKAIGNFDDFLTLLKEYLEEDALEYIRGALDGDAEDLAQLKKIAKIFEEGKGKIGRKLSKVEAEAGMEAFWGEGGEAGALAAIEIQFKITTSTLGKDELIVRDVKYLDINGNVDWEAWAPNGGRVLGTIREGQTLNVGTIIDRYGNQYGRYTSPVGVPYDQRALPYIENSNAYHQYEVIKPIDNVTISKIAAAFEQPGGGVQYELPQTINQLIQEGILKEIIR